MISQEELREQAKVYELNDGLGQLADFVLAQAFLAVGDRSVRSAGST